MPVESQTAAPEAEEQRTPESLPTRAPTAIIHRILEADGSILVRCPALSDRLAAKRTVGGSQVSENPYQTPSSGDVVHEEQPLQTERPKPVGIWVGLAANLLAVGAGAVVLLAGPGARLRGMEPEAKLFIVLTLAAIAVGLFALPISVVDLYRRRWLWGSIGALSSFSPYPLALVVAHAVGELFGITFD